MRHRYWFGGVKILATLALLALSANVSQAQVYKYLPTLTLQKHVAVGPNDITSRDTIYVAEAGPGEKRFFLLPVFVKNILDSVYNPVTGLGAEPIYSFRFKIQYNRTLIRAVGVQKRGPLPIDTGDVAAKNFNLSWDVAQDSLYKVLTVGTPSANGERIMVTGSSSIPLPLPLRRDAPPNNPSPQFKDTAVLLYVLFEVVGTSQGGGSGAVRDQIILTNDSIRWNDYRTSTPILNTTTGQYVPSPIDSFMIARGFNPNPQSQQGIFPPPIYPITYPPPASSEYNYGAVVIAITPRPRINLLPVGEVAQIAGDPSDFELVRVLQTQYGNQNRIFRNLLIQNATPGAVLRNITIETDQNWLRVSTEPIDNVQQGGENGERGIFIREVPGTQLDFNIIANPSLIPTNDGSMYPTPGIYTGYVTIRSDDAANSAVRVKVVLIVNRNPLESGLQDSTESVNTRGIRLTFRNSATNPDTTYLTFGTGVNATTGIDTLFAEAEGDTVLPNTFYARFFPFDTLKDENGNALHPFRGLIDTRNLPPTATNGEQSIDIRNFRVNTTHIYCVRFDAGAPQNYPVTIEYDTRDFPDGAQLFIRDAVNGNIFSQNLRTATSAGGTIRQFAIRDPNIKEFCIEYTLPAVVQFPEIRRGWNFVSMPVAPSDPRAGVVFPNIASGKPIFFSQNQYGQADTVRVGVGYFVKYGAILDRTVAGVRVCRIDSNTYPVRVYEGWNTVGALSVPTTVDLISFTPLPGQPVPQRVGEVYRYVTSRGYEQVSLIIPGYGYWVKVSADGYYRLVPPAGTDCQTSPKSIAGLAPTETFPTLARLTVSDNDNKVGTLYFGRDEAVVNGRYTLPPAPYTSLFDVRFDNDGFVSAAADVAAERVVRIQGVEYPVVVAVDRADASYNVVDAQTGRLLGSFEAGKPGAVVINDPSVKLVKLVGVAASEMGLGQALPNPATSTVNFSFNVVGEQNVSVKLYSQLGNEVASLFDGRVSGTQDVAFRTEGLPAGVYYYKMTTSSGFSQVRQVVVAK